MQTIETILVQHPFFQGMEPRHIQLIAGCASNFNIAAGKYIVHEGEEAELFYLIRRGRVALEAHAAERGPITIETIEAGEVLGWSWLFPPFRWHFSARTMESTQGILINGQCLRAKGEADHDLGYELVKRVAQVMMQRLQATRLQLLDLYAVGQRGVL